jgi:hypothetical protein
VVVGRPGVAQHGPVFVATANTLIPIPASYATEGLIKTVQGSSIPEAKKRTFVARLKRISREQVTLGNLARLTAIAKQIADVIKDFK